MTVTLYIDNQLDQATEVDPAELAAEFVKAALDGCEVPARGSIEFAYRYWISGPEGRSASWDESEWETMVDGLVAQFEANPDAKTKLWEMVCP